MYPISLLWYSYIGTLILYGYVSVSIVVRVSIVYLSSNVLYYSTRTTCIAICYMLSITTIQLSNYFMFLAVSVPHE